jgi:TolB protein
MLFDFVRASYDSPRKTFTDLSRRLRDGVSLENELVSSGTAPATTNLHQSWIPAYDPTGEHLALTRRPDDTSGLFIVDEGKPARVLLERKEEILGPQWSPDSRQIVFGIGRFALFNAGEKAMDAPNGEEQLGIVNVDGSGFHLISSGANKNAFPSFAPDGKHIVYRTTGPDGEGLRILNLGDHSITVLTNEYDNFPLWSPRGDLIAFIRKIGARL